MMKSITTHKNGQYVYRGQWCTIISVKNSDLQVKTVEIMVVLFAETAMLSCFIQPVTNLAARNFLIKQKRINIILPMQFDRYLLIINISQYTSQVLHIAFLGYNRLKDHKSWVLQIHYGKLSCDNRK